MSRRKNIDPTPLIPERRPKATIGDVVVWLNSVRFGKWEWCRNPRCKYVTIGFDTRSGVYSIKDRDGNEITLEELQRQFKGDNR